MNFCEVLNGLVTPLILGVPVIVVLVLLVLVNITDHARPIIDPVTHEERYRHSHVFLEILALVIIVTVVCVGVLSLTGLFAHCY